MRQLAILLFLAGFAAGGEQTDEDYVGSERCTKCHLREAKAWRASTHARHGTALAEPEGGADAAVGARWMQAYLRRDALGYYRILPVCRDLREERWRDTVEVLDTIRGTTMAGTRSHAGALGGRSFDADCSGCHASQARVRMTEFGRMDTVWRDLAINCEACHGPGAEHSRSWEDLGEGTPMPRIEKLGTRAATAICTRCHGGPTAQWDFGPADAPHFVGLIMDRDGLYPDGAASGQAYQFVGFSRSPCFTKGGLTCTGCHDAHGPQLRDTGNPDGICVGCHTGYARREHTFHSPAGAGARCVECHMPKLLDGIMAHQRDHRIASPLPASPRSPDACTACHRDKSKAWADAAYRRWWGEPPAATLSAIEGVYLARQRVAAAAPLLRKALRHPDPFLRAAAAGYLGEPDAILDDDSPEVRRVALFVAAGSEPHLRKLLRDPEPVLRGLAAVELSRLGRSLAPELRADVEIVARHVRQNPRARLILAVDDLGAGRADRAARRFRELLPFAPESEEAWRGLATALRMLGQDEGARAAGLRLAGILDGRRAERPANVPLIAATVAAYVENGNRARARDILTESLRIVRGRDAVAVREMLRRLEETSR